MSEKQKRDKLLAERDTRILNRIKAGVSVRTVATEEGFEADYTGKLCAHLAKKAGVPYTPSTKRNQHPNMVPPGLTQPGRLRSEAKRGHQALSLDVGEETALPRSLSRRRPNAGRAAHGGETAQTPTIGG